MLLASRIASIILRIGEIAFAAVSRWPSLLGNDSKYPQVVAGIMGSYWHDLSQENIVPQKQFIYLQILSALSLLFGTLWLIPFSGSFQHWPVDFFLALAWFAGFAILITYVGGTDCRAEMYKFETITAGGICNRWKAVEIFSILSAVFWLVHVLIAFWFFYRNKTKDKKKGKSSSA